MKKARKLGLQSLALVLMAFVLVAGVAFGMTGAWFTDTQTKDAEQVTLDNKVVIDATKIAVNSAYSGTRLNAAQTGVETTTITKDDVMPGDEITLTFKVAKAAVSSDFAAKVRIVVKYESVAIATTGNDKITYTQETRKGEAAYATYANDTVFFVGDDTDVKIVLTLHGDEFKNTDALKKIDVQVVTEAIQAANYVVGNWDDHDIVANTQDWTPGE